MAQVKSIEPGKYNKALALALKKDYSEISQPEWSEFVKSSSHRKRITQDTEY